MSNAKFGFLVIVMTLFTFVAFRHAAFINQISDRQDIKINKMEIELERSNKALQDQLEERITILQREVEDLRMIVGGKSTLDQGPTIPFFVPKR